MSKVGVIRKNGRGLRVERLIQTNAAPIAGAGGVLTFTVTPATFGMRGVYSVQGRIGVTPGTGLAVTESGGTGGFAQTYDPAKDSITGVQTVFINNNVGAIPAGNAFVIWEAIGY